MVKAPAAPGARPAGGAARRPRPTSISQFGFGGFNVIEFNPDDSVSVSPIIMRRDIRDLLEQRIIVFYTGITRSASAILSAQSAESGSNKDKQAALKRMVELVYVMRDELSQGHVDSFGHILHENWSLKKTLTSGISTPAIDE